MGSSQAVNPETFRVLPGYACLFANLQAAGSAFSYLRAVCRLLFVFRRAAQISAAQISTSSINLKYQPGNTGVAAAGFWTPPNLHAATSKLSVGSLVQMPKIVCAHCGLPLVCRRLRA